MLSRPTIPQSYCILPSRTYLMAIPHTHSQILIQQRNARRLRRSPPMKLNSCKRCKCQPPIFCSNNKGKRVKPRRSSVSNFKSASLIRCLRANPSFSLNSCTNRSTFIRNQQPVDKLRLGILQKCQLRKKCRPNRWLFRREENIKKVFCSKDFLRTPSMLALTGKVWG